MQVIFADADRVRSAGRHERARGEGAPSIADPDGVMAVAQRMPTAAPAA